MEHETCDNGDNICICYSRYSHQRIGTRTGGLGNNTTSGDHPNNSIAVIGQNTKKSPGDLRRLAVSRSPVEDHQLTLM